MMMVLVSMVNGTTTEQLRVCPMMRAQRSIDNEVMNEVMINNMSFNFTYKSRRYNLEYSLLKYNMCQMYSFYSCALKVKSQSDWKMYKN